MQKKEAIQGACNSCEKIDNTRFWKWEEHPIPDNPTAINPINTPTPVVTTPDLYPSQMPTPIVNIQNAPNVPDPQGYNSLLQVLGTKGLFDNITGLDANQRNALESMLSSQNAAQNYASMASQLANAGMQYKLMEDMKQNVNNDNTKTAAERKAQVAEIEQAQLAALKKIGTSNDLATNDLANFETGQDIADRLGHYGKSFKVKQQNADGSSLEVEGEGTGSVDEENKVLRHKYSDLVLNESTYQNVLGGILDSYAGTGKGFSINTDGSITIEILLLAIGQSMSMGKAKVYRQYFADTIAQEMSGNNSMHIWDKKGFSYSNYLTLLPNGHIANPNQIQVDKGILSKLQVANTNQADNIQYIVKIIDNSVDGLIFIEDPLSLGNNQVLLILQDEYVMRSFIRGDRRTGIMNFKDMRKYQNNNLYSRTAAHEFGHILGLADRYHFVLTYGTDANGVNFVEPVAGLTPNTPMIEYTSFEQGEGFLQNKNFNQVYEFDPSANEMNNLMANLSSAGVTISDYQWNIIFHQKIEPQLPQFMFMLPPNLNQNQISAIGIEYDNMGNIVEQVMDLNGNITNNASVACISDVNGLTNVDSGGYSDDEIRTIVQQLNSDPLTALAPGSTIPLIDNWANSGKANAMGRTIWNSTNLGSIIVDGIGYTYLIYFNRANIINSLNN